MPINAFGDIAGLQARWSARESAPVVNAAGVITDFGSELSGSGATFAAVNTVRMALGDSPGMLHPYAGEINTSGNNYGGLEILLPGSFDTRRMMMAAAVTPMAMIGNNSIVSSTAARILATNGTNAGDAPYASIFKTNKTGGTATNGLVLAAGGSGVNAATFARAGIERQVFGALGVSSVGQHAYLHDATGKSTTPGGASLSAVKRLCVGVLANASNSLNTLGGFNGVIHEVVFYQLSTGDYNEQNLLDVMALLASKWSVVRSSAIGVAICGDSIGFSSGSQNDDQVTSPSTAKKTTLNASFAKGVSSITVAAVPSGWGNTTRFVIDPGTSIAESLVITGTPSGGTINTTTALRFAHSSGAVVTDDYFGFMSPYCAWPTMAKGIGPGTGVRVYNYSTPGQQLQTVVSTAAINTTLNANSSAGATTISVASTTSFISGMSIVIGAGTANVENGIISGTPTGGVITLAAALQYAHTSGDVVRGDLDGSLGILKDTTQSVYVIQRGTNDMGPGSRTAAQLFADAKSIRNIASSSGATYIIACQVLPRADYPSLPYATYNTSLAGAIGTSTDQFNAIARFCDHPWLGGTGAAAACYNPATITVSGATAATTITGLIYDGSGVHPRAFGNACQALMMDAAYASARGTSVGYAPSVPTGLAVVSGANVVLTWSTPASPNAPKLPGTTTDGPSCLQVKIRRNGTLIATVAPSAINTNTGAATYPTTYTDTGNPQRLAYTIEVVDAAGNTSGQVNVPVPTDIQISGDRDRDLRDGRVRP